MGSIFPEELGGAGLGYIEYVHHHRGTVARGWLGRHHRRRPHFALLQPHLQDGQRRAAQRGYLPKLATGEWIGCWSLTEPEAGSDAAGTRTTAPRRWTAAGCSTAPRPSPPTRTTPTSAWPWRSPIAPPRSTASRPSSSRRARRASARQEGKQARPARQRHRRGDLRELPRSRADAAARQAEGEGFVDSLKVLDGGRISIAALVHRHGAGRLRRGAAATPSCASSSAGRSPSSRPSSTSWSTWRPRIDAARLLNYRAGLDAGPRASA